MQLRMVLPIFTANGGHLGFPDFYESDFNRLFFVIDYVQQDRKPLRIFLFYFFGGHEVGLVGLVLEYEVHYWMDTLAGPHIKVNL